jgi:hypothetical protein
MLAAACGSRRETAVQTAMEVPEEVKGLNWGAFLLNWIWAIGNQVWIGLLALVPCINLFVAIYLLIKGNELAWTGPRQWDSVEQFQAVQAAWTKWGVIILIVGIVLWVLQVIFMGALIGAGVATQGAQ